MIILIAREAVSTGRNIRDAIMDYVAFYECGLFM
jgi:hypothetical protein